MSTRELLQFNQFYILVRPIWRNWGSMQLKSTTTRSNNMNDQPKSSLAEVLAGSDKIQSTKVEGQSQDKDLVGAQADDSNEIPDPGEWTTGGDEMTDAQRNYLAALANRSGETLDVSDMNKAEASQHIDRLRQQTGQQSAGQ